MKTIGSAEKLTAKEVAGQYGISVSSLCLWRQRHQGPAFYEVTKSKFFYLREDVEKYFANARVETTGKRGRPAGRKPAKAE